MYQQKGSRYIGPYFGILYHGITWGLTGEIDRRAAQERYVNKSGLIDVKLNVLQERYLNKDVRFF